jgi:hypothetical protein
MCDERERLIGFVYDECEPAERREVERHLEGCVTCRREISGLRGTRQDLLAWDVPNHESVWRPFVPPPVIPSWRQIPMWTLAAAASVMFAVGAAGGVATHVVLSRGVAGPMQARLTPPPPAGPQDQVESARAGATELAALEDRIYARLRQTEARMQSMSSHVTGRALSQAVSTGPSTADLLQELRYLRELQAAQTSLNFRLVNDVGDLTSRTKKIEAIGYASSPADK